LESLEIREKFVYFGSQHFRLNLYGKSGLLQCFIHSFLCTLLGFMTEMKKKENFQNALANPK